MNEVTITPELINLAYAMIAAGLIMPIVLIVAMVRCNKNQDLTRSQKWLWQIGHLVLMFPAYIYLIVIDKSPWWKAAGAISLIATLWLTYYVVQNASALPDMPAF